MTIGFRATVIAVLCATVLGFSACTHSMVEEGFGQAFEANVDQMIANPDAGQSEAGPIALDSHTAEGVARGYHEGQKRESVDTPTASLIEIEH